MVDEDSDDGKSSDSFDDKMDDDSAE